MKNKTLILLKIKDIAKVLKIPQGTIKTRLNRARKKLNEILEEVNVNEWNGWNY